MGHGRATCGPQGEYRCSRPVILKVVYVDPQGSMTTCKQGLLQSEKHGKESMRQKSLGTSDPRLDLVSPRLDRNSAEFSSFVGAHFKFHFVVGHRVESMAALVSEYTLEFFTLLNARSKKELIEWCMKEGLIASSYECPKCNEQMGLNERKSVVLDGFEWRCRKKV
ncbi:uncharacterized protein TNCV_1978891 [Trichonephila clavipes]|nr:uncharacterized protein TNCV_1978891 [Trichonephila clavipes]